MPTRLDRSRSAAYARQSGRCYYCEFPMWLDDPAAFCVRHNLTPKLAKLLRCTAEHLKARRDGGNDEAGNIVAACLTCNQRRHRPKLPLSPEQFREHVRARLRQGRWHPSKMLLALARQAMPDYDSELHEHAKTSASPCHEHGGRLRHLHDGVDRARPGVQMHKRHRHDDLLGFSVWCWKQANQASG